jgi:deoxyribodipyrimidine photo-lyase
MHIGIFCFRRDLRLHDNLALQQLVQMCDSIVPVFCLDPRQLNAQHNAYYSPYAVKFMFESLMDLDRQISRHSENARLHIVSGRPDVCLPSIVHTLVKQQTTSRVSVAWNEDNTPFSMQRDKQTTRALQALQTTSKISIHTHPDDVTIVPVRNICTNTGGKYQKFTPFYRKALSAGVNAPISLPDGTPFVSLNNVQLLGINAHQLFEQTQFAHLQQIRSCVEGGRDEALQRLTDEYILQRCSKYNKERDHTWEEKTTRLSAYFKFGCVSFREAYHKVSDALHHSHPVAAEALTREFFWNAFYSYVSHCFPRVLDGQLTPASKRTRKQAPTQQNKDMVANAKLNHIWDTAHPEHLQRWKDGMTGFPYIDAAMRQLKTTGWMHNRARMAVASFLVKDLRIDWREGEKHFAQHLVDYDPSANNGGWQWASSTGADAMQYTRIFNPWTQSSKFDPNGMYIKLYVKELSDPKLPAKELHKWHDAQIREQYETHPTISTYPTPIIDHTQARKETLRLWKQPVTTTTTTKKKKA